MAFFFLSFHGVLSLCHPGCGALYSLSSWGLTPGSRYINLFASANSNLICVVYKIYGHYKFVRALRGILMTWIPGSSPGMTNFCGLRFNHAMTMGTKYKIAYSLTTPPLRGTPPQRGTWSSSHHGISSPPLEGWATPGPARRVAWVVKTGVVRECGIRGNVLKHY